jgi:hypothetical protein
VKRVPLILVAFGLVFGLQLSAQIEKVLPKRGSSSLEGTSFVVGFMQNEILEIGADPRLQIFISSQYDATVTIESAALGRVIVPIAAKTVHVETLSPYHANSASEMIQQKSVFISSDVPIVVYVLNTLLRSTDSYAAIPIRHLGTQYYSINRPTDYYLPNNRDRTATIPRVGEFMIMASEDDTRVTITPAATTSRMGISARTPFSISLDRGDCYLVQARATGHGRDDLTGSSISSTKPVAVISGHMRSSIPLSMSSSKDHLVEQLTPADKWGRAYVTAPLAMSNRPDMFRIMASLPGQTIRLTTANGLKTFQMSAVGAWADTLLSEPASWSSADPFFMVQLMSSQIDTSRAFDPAMVIVPPIEQFVNETLFRFPTLEPDNSVRNQRFFYCINLVATRDALSSLRIDGRLATATAPLLAMQVVPGTSIHWAHVYLQEGTHVVTCDSGSFSAIMYGTSRNDSYANLVGLAFEPLRKRDDTPPVYSSKIDCGTITGSIRDTSRDTANLKDVSVIGSRTFNYIWSISEPLDSAGSVEFQASVRDMTRDAQLVIHAYDDRGNGKEWLYRYDAPLIDVARDVVIDAQRGRERCTTMVIRNRDSTPVTIRAMSRQGNQRIVITDPIGPFTIKARDSVSVRVCATQWADTTAMAASIDIELPCGLLRTFYVKTRVSSSITGDTIDFGDVRLGDTACGRAAIVNNGDKPTDLDKLIATKLDSSFTLDTVALGLPRQIPPGDTVWVEVCVVPRQQGAITRVDSIVSSSGVEAWVVCRARGVRPRVASVVIDWKERRVGSVSDTTIVLRNTGDGWCWAEPSFPRAASAFSLSGVPGNGARIDGVDSLVIRSSFRPTTRDTLSEVLPVSIDWAPHAPVSITLMGIGVMPDISVQDVNFGTIVVDTRRDTLVDLITTGFSGGNTELLVRGIGIVGPDSSSFVLPASILTSVGTTRPLPSRLNDVVVFAPTRLGVHECFVDIDHDAMPCGQAGRSRFRLYGRAIDRPRPDVTLDFSTRVRVRPCNDEPITIDLVNQGTAPTRIDSVTVRAGDDVVDVSGNVGLFDLLPGERWTFSFIHRWIVESPSIATIRVVDSAGVVLLDTILIEIIPPKTSIEAAFVGGAGSLAGPARIRLTAGLADVQDVSLPISMSLSIERQRFVLGPLDSSQVVLTTAAGARLIPASIEQDSGRIALRVLEPVKGPWTIDCRVFGTVLWKDPDPDSMRATLQVTPCYLQQQSSYVEFGIDPCGSRRRIVTIGSISGLALRPLGQPFSQVISLEVESSLTANARVWAESLAGDQFMLTEHLSLQKGRQHCNFSCSGWPSGVYRLVFMLEQGVEVTNIIIVN